MTLSTLHCCRVSRITSDRLHLGLAGRFPEPAGFPAGSYRPLPAATGGGQAIDRNRPGSGHNGCRKPAGRMGSFRPVKLGRKLAGTGPVLTTGCLCKYRSDVSR